MATEFVLTAVHLYFLIPEIKCPVETFEEKPTCEINAYKIHQCVYDNDASQKKYDNCLIVFPSTNLTNNECGSEINKYKTVWRTNTAPFSGYEKHVGNRTDVRVAWRHHCFFSFLDKGETETITYCARMEKTAQRLMEELIKYTKGSKYAGLKNLNYLPIGGKFGSSTGMRTLEQATRTCRGDVTVIGWDRWWHQEQYRKHGGPKMVKTYYFSNELSDLSLRNHDYEKEYNNVKKECKIEKLNFPDHVIREQYIFKRK